MNKAQGPAMARGTKALATLPPVSSFDDDTIDQLADVFHLLADRSRMKILIALANQGEMHVTALCDMLSQSQPAVSHHLCLMRSKLVGYRREGKHNFYYLKSGPLRDLLEQVFSQCGNGHQRIQFQDFSLAFKRTRKR